MCERPRGCSNKCAVGIERDLGRDNAHRRVQSIVLRFKQTLGVIVLRRFWALRQHGARFGCGEHRIFHGDTGLGVIVTARAHTYTGTHQTRFVSYVGMEVALLRAGLDRP